MIVVRASYEVLTPSSQLNSALSLIEMAGRTCYKSEAKITVDSGPAFSKMILKRGHESVIEHAWMSVRFVVDRGVSHELVRHRLASFSQESTRYCNYGKPGGVTYVLPCTLFEVVDGKERRREPLYSAWEDQMLAAERCYLFMLAEGAKPEEARAVLPNSLKTEVVMSANLREWRHVLRLRTSERAHPQMREVMVPLLAEVRGMVPVLFDDLVHTEEVR